MAEKEIDDHSGVETTGHEWDGIKELNNPLPRWWLIVFWVSVVWSIGYWILMPAWPGITGYTKGVRNHSERANVAADLDALAAERGRSDPAADRGAVAGGHRKRSGSVAVCDGGGRIAIWR